MQRDDEHHPLMISCENARSLVPSYLDGELSEAQASPLRAHLIDCASCRKSAKEGKNLRRWFADSLPAETVQVPEGFAARVARRAFAGDPGLLMPALPGSGGAAHGRELLPFVLAVTTAAAGLLLYFSLEIQRASLPASGPLGADDYRPPWEQVEHSEAVPNGALIDRPAEERWSPDALVQPVGGVLEGVPPVEEDEEQEGSDEDADGDER